MGELTIERMRPELEDVFLHLHSDANDAGWCRCVAWWVPTWDGWSERTSEENLALRCALFECGEHDGVLALDDGVPVGWCQVGPRDRLPKLVEQLELTSDPRTWAVTCFLVAPHARGRGVATALLAAAVDAARSDGARRVEGYPRAGSRLEPEDAWSGAERLFASAGFRRIGALGPRVVVELDIDRSPV